MFSKFSAKKPYTVFVGVVMILVLGVVSLSRMSTDLLPNISLPYVMIMTPYTGASPETVETVVTKPIESSMATVSNIEGMMSMSGDSYSMVAMQFTQTANMDSISLEINEKLDQIASFWDDSVGSPIIMKMNPDMLPIMIAAVGKENLDAVEISDFVEKDISPRLESIEGVASVSETGLIEESVHVIIQQEKIDKINEQVFGYIDDQMADAQKEINDGKSDLAKNEKDINDNVNDLNDKQNDLEKSKNDLATQRTEIANQKEDLKNGQETLNKAQMEQATQLATELSENIAKKMAAEKTLMEVPKKLETEENAYFEQYNFELKSDIEFLKLTKQMSDDNRLDPSILENPDLKFNFSETEIAKLKSLFPTELSSVNVELPLSEKDSKLVSDIFRNHLISLQTNKERNQKILAFKNLGEGAAAEVNQAQIDLADALKKIAEIEAKQTIISSELGSQKGTLNIAQQQLEGADKQFDQAEEQLKTGQEQIDSAREQINDAKSQINDARDQLKDAQEELDSEWDNALVNADMNGVLTVETVKQLLTAQNFSMPAGFVTEDGVSYLVRVGDKPDDVEKLKAMPLMNLQMDGVDIITLGDVADVFMTDNSKEVYTNVNGQPGVILALQKQTGYSTGDVSDLINEEFEDIQGEDASITILKLMDQGIYIDMVMDSIMNNIFLGGFLAILVLILFLKDLRPTLIIAISIPVSVIAAIVCMYFSHVTLNIISLSGLALGIGMLVDNSIVVIENIYRLRNSGYSIQEAAIEGAKEVTGAITASTLTTVCVFAPIIFTKGITRQLFVDMGLTIGYSLGASLLIAVTVVPALSSKMLKNAKKEKETSFFKRLSSLYGKTIPYALKFRWLVLLFTIVMLAVSAIFAFKRGTAFMPSMDSTQLTAKVEMPDHYQLKDTRAVADMVIAEIQELKDVEDVGAMLGSDNMLSVEADPHRVDIYVTLKADKELPAVEVGDQVENIILAHPGLTASVSAEAMDTSALMGSGITINVKGRDIDTLQEIAKNLAKELKKVEGIETVNDGLEDAEEELRVIIDRDKAMDYGLTVAQVFQQINSKITKDNGSIELSTDTKEYDIYVIHQANENMSRADIKNMMIDYQDQDKNAKKIPLREIANFEKAMSLNIVNRINQTRYIAVSASIKDGYNIGLVSKEVEKALQNFEMPKGYDLEFDGENEMIEDSMDQLRLMLFLAIVFMFLIMVAQFQSLKSPFIIMFTIPLAFTGGFLGLYLSKSEVSVIAMLGFIMLAGIIVNNGIVLVDYINQLRATGMEKREAIAEAGRTRLRPVLMTALTTLLSMCTMIFSHSMGADMSKPMAVVIVGGLVYGTLLTLYVVPCIYDILNPEKRKKDKRTGIKKFFQDRKKEVLTVED